MRIYSRQRKCLVESFGNVGVGQAKAVQNMDGELIKVNRDIHKGKRVNIVFDIMHIVSNSPITLMRTDKILMMNHDPSTRRRGKRLFESSPCSTRCGGGKDKLH